MSLICPWRRNRCNSAGQDEFNQAARRERIRFGQPGKALDFLRLSHLILHSCPHRLEA